jgi:hypothetical protein
VTSQTRAVATDRKNELNDVKVFVKVFEPRVENLK